MRTLCFAFFFFFLTNIVLGQSNCLFKNPLCFYNTDILNYVQLLKNNLQTEKLLPFFHGPFYDSLKKEDKIRFLEKSPLGYQLKRVGIRAIDSKCWKLTYSRVILGTREQFMIQVDLIKDTCRIYLDETAVKTLFP